MLKVTDLRETELDFGELAAVLPRAALDVETALAQVKPIIEEVRVRGGAALRDFSERFDGVRPQHLRVPAAALEKALEELDPKVRQAIEISIAHNRLGHLAQLPEEKTTEIVPGGFVTQRWIPVRRVGLYVPGGLAVYPSSVVMNVVAAQVSGVKEIALASPPQQDFGGLPHPTILAACQLLGVREVYAVGGAQAIGMFALGASEEDGSSLCQAVDVVTGPGNIFVAAAKRAVSSICGIDAEAGTTEIAIIADESANARWVARDLISQAEHDPAAASVLLTPSFGLVQKVLREVDLFARQTKHSQRVIEALSGPQSGIILVRDISQAKQVANAYGAEHLEIHTVNADLDAQDIYNAGAIFVGPHTPVPLGDYLAGSNHVLPTGGTARFRAGLSVMAYIKPVQQIKYSAAALAALSDPLTVFANSEDLPAHGEAVRERQR